LTDASCALAVQGAVMDFERRLALHTD